jgi:hypothetical protein
MQTKAGRRPGRPLHHTKGRIAEALVEGMLMRAGYAVSRVGRESHVPALLKTGKDEFVPHFMVRKAVERPDSDGPLHHVIPIEVKYRHDLARFLRGEAAHFFEAAKRWPDLCLILVTDRPDDGRSCFQVLQGADESTRTTTDLDQVTVLDIYPSTVVEYAHLATKLFSLAGPRATQSKILVG